MHLRKLILSIALDIEHALKTQLLYDLSRNDIEDGYSIVSQYLSVDYNRENLLLIKLVNLQQVI